MKQVHDEAVGKEKEILRKIPEAKLVLWPLGIYYYLLDLGKACGTNIRSPRGDDGSLRIWTHVTTCGDDFTRLCRYERSFTHILIYILCLNTERNESRLKRAEVETVRREDPHSLMLLLSKGKIASRAGVDAPTPDGTAHVRCARTGAARE